MDTWVRWQKVALCILIVWEIRLEDLLISFRPFDQSAYEVEVYLRNRDVQRLDVLYRAKLSYCGIVEQQRPMQSSARRIAQIGRILGYFDLAELFRVLLPIRRNC